MPLSDKQKAWLKQGIGLSVPIDGSGRSGKIVSLHVTSDGFVLAQTSPGYDRGVFLGRVPSDDALSDA